MLGCSSDWTKGRGLDLLRQTPGAQKAKGPACKFCGYGKYIDIVIPEQTWTGKVLLLQHSSLRNMEIWEKIVHLHFYSEIHECIPTHTHTHVCLGLGFKTAQGKKPWSHLGLQLRKKKE